MVFVSRLGLAPEKNKTNHTDIIATLTAENAQLRAENDRLRAALTQTAKPVTDRKQYMRDYMRRKRAEQKGEASNAEQGASTL